MASYSAWLFVALQANCSACSISRSPSRSRTTPAPHEVLLEDPSTYSVHVMEVSGCGGSSVEKSTKHWDLMAPLES